MTDEQARDLFAWPRAISRRSYNASTLLVDMMREPRNWRQRPWADQVVFICGCGHSGTTVAMRILGAHPSMWAPNYETGAFSTGFRPWSKLRSLRQDFLTSGKRVLVEKTPSHIRHMDQIRHAIPGIRFLLLIRDGRDVAVSIARRLGGDFEAGVKRWVDDNTALLKESSSDDVFCLRYEDLIADPCRFTAQICAWLGLPPDPGMLDFHRTDFAWREEKTPMPPKEIQHKDRRAHQVNQPLFDGRGAWKHELPPEFAAAFTRGEAGRIMKEFGYI